MFFFEVNVREDKYSIVWFTCEWFGNYLPLAAETLLYWRLAPLASGCSSTTGRLRETFSRPPYCLCPVDIRPYQSGILNRPTGNTVAEYASSFLFSPFLVAHNHMPPSKTDDSDLSEGSRLRVEMLAMGRWSRASSTVFVECQISATKEDQLDIAPLFVIHTSDVCPVVRMHFLEKICEMAQYDTVQWLLKIQVLIIFSWDSLLKPFWHNRC